MLVQEGICKSPNLLGERSTEHMGFTLRRHIFFEYDGPYLRLKAHVEHTIAFVKDEILDMDACDYAFGHVVDETSGCGYQNVYSSV